MAQTTAPRHNHAGRHRHADREQYVFVGNLDKIFRPERIAVVGAGTQPGSVGYALFRNLIGSGYQGVVYPVNVAHEAVQGVRAYTTLKDVPETPDLAILATPAATIPGLVRQCGEIGVPGVAIIAAGFRETGPGGAQLEARIREVAANFRGLRVLGPNCLGFAVPRLGLNASFAAGMPRDGSVAFISQSGALCTAVLDWAVREQVGFSHFISIGNAVDVDFGELIDYLGQDARTRSMLLYIESLTDSRRFLSAARSFARTKPIVAYKAGRFQASAKAIASHTGALAGEDAVYDAAFRRAGIVRVDRLDEMVQCAELLARQRRPTGRRLAILTNAGGPGVMALDTLIARRGTLATLSPSTLERLNAFLPPHWSRDNPVDILGDAPAERFARAAEILLADAAVDTLLIILAPQAMTDPTETAEAIAPLAVRTVKPILAAWMGGPSVENGVRILNEAGVSTYDNPEQATSAFMSLIAYQRNIETLYETPRDIPLGAIADKSKLREFSECLRNRAGSVLSEVASKAILEAYGIPSTRPAPAGSAQEAAKVATELGFPVVLKIDSDQISHKSDIGGVALNLASVDAVTRAFEEITQAARKARPEATIRGVTVQPMIVPLRPLELILGSRRDSTFGAAIVVGMGGVATEVFSDRVIGLPPLNERLARRMLESLRIWPLLAGYRGQPAAPIDALIQTLIRFSYLVANQPEIAEIDINPLLVTQETIIALDARIILDPDFPRPSSRPFDHLAIRPYPEEFIHPALLRGGREVLLRPIKAEDEPLWHRMVGECSSESIRLRFFSSLRSASHEMAVRFCVIDYDRELAIVAEDSSGGDRKLLGIGRLVADPDHERAEFALLVADPYQGTGVGSRLLAYLIEIAKPWGIKTIYAETLPENRRMISMLRKFGFETRGDPQAGVVFAERPVDSGPSLPAVVVEPIDDPREKPNGPCP